MMWGSPAGHWQVTGGSRGGGGGVVTTGNAFRIQVAPQQTHSLQVEPLLCVVTDPMKSVTKLGRAITTPPTPSPGSAAGTPGSSGACAAAGEATHLHPTLPHPTPLTPRSPHAYATQIPLSPHANPSPRPPNPVPDPLTYSGFVTPPVP